MWIPTVDESFPLFPLQLWIRPRWGSTNIRDVRIIAVESWLRQLQRQDGEALANSTKAKIHNLMSVLFNHAIRYEWLEQGRNPIKLVRQSTLRQLTPTVLEPHEIRNLLSELQPPHQQMVLLDVTTGLRRSELFALKWSDVDFSNLTIDIKRSIFQGVVGSCKTAASRAPVPLSLDLAANLWLWKEMTRYAKPDDWIFASPRAKGKTFLSPHHAGEMDSAGCGAGQHYEKDRLAHISTHLFDDADRQW